jgi:hypothetical protein
MLRNVSLLIAGLALLAHPASAAERGRTAYDALIARHAAANGVPEALVRKVIMRESRGNARIVGRCGCYGLMQIKPATARRLGYTGSAAGLLDPDTNLAYGVRYLAGAYRAAGGNASRAEAYYRSGYYASRRQRGTAIVTASAVPSQPAVNAAAPVADVAVTGTVAPRTPLRAQRATARAERAAARQSYRARTTTANPIAKWFASWTTPSPKARRASRASAAARM